MRHEIDLHGKRVQEKIDILKNRFNEYYLAIHHRRKALEEAKRRPPTEEPAALGSALRIPEKNLNDIEYEDVEVDLREQENISDFE